LLAIASEREGGAHQRYELGAAAVTEPRTPVRVDLRKYGSRGYRPGRPFLVRALWLLVEAAVFLNPAVTSYRSKRYLLRRFGAQLGEDVTIKPNVHIKNPWLLTVGDHVWLGERSWIDNLAPVSIGSHACISQGAYLCTGNHDWTDPGMGLMVGEIHVGAGAWVGAFARIAPGVAIAEESIVSLGTVQLADTEPRGIYSGNPGQKVGERRMYERDAR
jgi:putative colanic acid biosynthesis acetyltransferase WcaF